MNSPITAHMTVEKTSVQRVMLTIPEAAQACGIGETAIKEAIRSKQLRSGKFGRSRRILVDDLREWARRIVVTSEGRGESPTDLTQTQVIEKTVSA